MKRIKKQLWVLAALVGLCTLHIAMGDKDLNDYRDLQQNSLDKFEGYYRFPNRVAYIQFEVVEDHLQARQVWDDRRYVLKRTGDLTFEAKDEQYKLAFDAARPTFVKILDRVDLTRVDFNPTQRQRVTASLASVYTGSYYLQRDETYKIEVILEGEDIVLVQGWDGKRIPLASITDQEFINQEGEMPVTFYEEDGKGVVMRCFEDGRWFKEDK